MKLEKNSNGILYKNKIQTNYKNMFSLKMNEIEALINNDNLEEKQKPHPLLFMQQCMLYDQLDNPKINVHNLTRLWLHDIENLL